jgi:hypothetical protein
MTIHFLLSVSSEVNYNSAFNHSNLGFKFSYVYSSNAYSLISFFPMIFSAQLIAVYCLIPQERL